MWHFSRPAARAVRRRPTRLATRPAPLHGLAPRPVQRRQLALAHPPTPLRPPSAQRSKTMSTTGPTPPSTWPCRHSRWAASAILRRRQSWERPSALWLHSPESSPWESSRRWPCYRFRGTSYQPEPTRECDGIRTTGWTPAEAAVVVQGDEDRTSESGVRAGPLAFADEARCRRATAPPRASFGRRLAGSGRFWPRAPCGNRSLATYALLLELAESLNRELPWSVTPVATCWAGSRRQPQRRPAGWAQASNSWHSRRGSQPARR